MGAPASACVCAKHGAVRCGVHGPITPEMRADPRYRLSANPRVVAVEPREGILTVYDHHGVYMGCIGSETWQQLLLDGAARETA